MSWNTKHILTAFISAAALIGVYRYFDYVTSRNFLMQVNIPCNPRAEVCFEKVNNDDDGDEYYAKLQITEHLAPRCLQEHSCIDFSCPIELSEGDMCHVAYCSSETLEEGETCAIAEVP